tara:strand:- start:40 stop:642 length:603 start_codon:yes stop_codon:yes gene_type:complete
MNDVIDSHDEAKKFAEIALEMKKANDEGRFQDELELNEKLPKTSESYWYNRGNILSYLERTEESIDCYKKAIKIADSYVKAWYRLGQRYFEMGKFDDAIQAFVNTSVLENEGGQNEWNTAATFHYMLCLSHIYLQKPPGKRSDELGMKILDQIRKLRPIIDKDNSLDETEFLNYCMENFGEILTKLEPGILFEARTKDSI